MTLWNDGIAYRCRRVLRTPFAIVIFAALAMVGAALFAVTPGQAQILFEANRILYDTQSDIVTASGEVEVRENGRVLRADSVAYDRNANTVSASGHVTLTEVNGDVAFADSIELSGDLRQGVMQGLSVMLGENGRLAAVSGQRWDGRYTEANRAVFTACRLCAEDDNPTPTWQIKATRVVHDQVEKTLTFENATLELFGIPVVYTPVFSYPDPSVRHRSGLLAPGIGSSTHLGSFLRVPYYFSLGPSRDLTIEPFLTTGASSILQGEYRSRRNSGGFWLQGSLGYDDNAGDLPGGNEWLGHLFGSGRFQMNDRWRAGFDAQLTSNDTYLRRYEISDLDRLTSNLFVDRTNGRNRFAVDTFYFQSLRDGDATGAIPLIFPLIQNTYMPERKFYGGRLRFDTSALLLMRDQGTDMARGSVTADWMRAFATGSGQLITIDSLVRGDIYHVNDVLASMPTVPHDTDTIGRGLGYVALEWRWPFVGSAGFASTSLVIEPIVQLVAATGGGNPAGLPNEDSTTFEFDETTLFDPNEFPGLDLWTGGPRSNIGVRATAFFPRGSTELILGQEFRTRRAPNFAPGFGVGDQRSDIVGRIKVQLPPYLDITHRFRIDPAGGVLRRNEVYVSARYGRSMFSLSYLKLARETADPVLGQREEVDFTASLGVLGDWSVFAETRKDLEQGRWLGAGVGLLYDDGCFVAQIGFRRNETTDRDVRPSSSVILKFGIKTDLTAGLSP